MACEVLSQNIIHNVHYQEPHRELIEGCMQGDRTAQFQLYRQYAKAMYSVSLRMVNRVEDAEDVLQNAFADAFLHLKNYRYESSIGSWLKRIVINHSINFLKKKRIQWSEISDNNILQEETPELPNYCLQTHAIQQAIAELSEGYRVIFTLYALEGYDHQEIADILQIAESTSKSQYMRARKRLQEILLTNHQALFK